MLFEPFTFVDIRLVFEREELKSLRRNLENVLEEEFSAFLKPDLNYFCPRFLSELNGLGHLLV
jgi:hypothetical protein